MAFKLWFTCPHSYVITPDGAWHRGDCRLVDAENPNDCLAMEVGERLALSPAPTRCHRCYPEVIITGGPLEPDGA